MKIHTLARGPMRWNPSMGLSRVDYVYQRLSFAIATGEITRERVVAIQQELCSRYGASLSVVRRAIQRLSQAEAPPSVIGSPCAIQIPSALPVLALAERRITHTELAELERLVDQQPDDLTVCDSALFLARFWSQLGRATRNPLIEQETQRWSEVLLAHRHRAPIDSFYTSLALPAASYRRMVRVLRRGKGALKLWLSMIEPDRLVSSKE